MRRVLRLLLAAPLLVTSCTLQAGAGFATITPGTLEVAFEPGRARDLGNSVFLTDQGYRVRLEVARLHGMDLALLELREEAGDGALESADPPGEHVLCHGDHCHGDEGGLAHGEEVEAMHARGGARFSPLVTLPLDRELDLLAGARVALDDPMPSAELPRANIDRIEVRVTGLVLRGEIEGGALVEPAALEVDLAIAEPLVGTLSAHIDRDGPEEIALDVELHFDATMLDEIDLASLVDDGLVVIDAGSQHAEALTDWLLRAELHARL
jgi:hypothetical protein